MCRRAVMRVDDDEPSIVNIKVERPWFFQDEFVFFMHLGIRSPRLQLNPEVSITRFRASSYMNDVCLNMYFCLGQGIE